MPTELPYCLSITMLFSNVAVIVLVRRPLFQKNHFNNYLIYMYEHIRNVHENFKITNRQFVSKVFNRSYNLGSTKSEIPQLNFFKSTARYATLPYRTVRNRSSTVLVEKLESNLQQSEIDRHDIIFCTVQYRSPYNFFFNISFFLKKS